MSEDKCNCAVSCGGGPSALSLVFAGIILLGAAGTCDVSWWQYAVLLVGVVVL